MKQKFTFWQPSKTPFHLREGVQKGIRMVGVMMPSGVISRNGVLYDWESVKRTHKDLINKPVMYNHVIEGAEAKSIGHYTNSSILTASQAMNKYKDIPEFVNELSKYEPEQELWVYEADINPNKKEQVEEIRRGDIRHVSIQLSPNEEETREEISPEGKSYTYAVVEDIIEGSVVPTPGFLDTSAILVENFKRKTRQENSEDVTTDTGSGATVVKLRDEKDFKDYAVKKCEVCGNSQFYHLNNDFRQCSKCKTVQSKNALVENSEVKKSEFQKEKSFEERADELLSELSQEDIESAGL